MLKQYSKFNKKIILNSSLRLSVFFAALYLLLALFGLYKVNAAEESIDSRNVYFKLQQESSPFSIPLEKYSELYSQLCNISFCNYYECYLQYLDRLPASQSFFNYETGALCANCPAALCVQISENLQKSNQFECYAGRLLDSGDFRYNGGNIPIILGYEYRDLLPLGSQFSATYLYNVYTFEVVGVLTKNSNISNPTTTIYLDKYIIIPSFHVLKFPENTDGIRIHYANKTSGLLTVPKEKFADASDFLKQLLSNAGCGDYSIDIYPVKYSVIERTGLRIEWLLLCLLAVTLFSIFFYIKYIRRKKEYISRNKLLFTCAEFIGSFLFFIILYSPLSYLLILRIDIKAFLLCEIFIAAIRNIILIFQKKHISFENDKSA